MKEDDYRLGLSSSLWPENYLVTRSFEKRSWRCEKIKNSFQLFGHRKTTFCHGNLCKYELNIQVYIVYSIQYFTIICKQELMKRVINYINF